MARQGQVIGRTAICSAARSVFACRPTCSMRHPGTSRRRTSSSFSIHDLGGRLSASFLKPALWGTRNDLLIDALGERVSTSGAGFFGYEVEDADATAALAPSIQPDLLDSGGDRSADRRRHGFARPGRLHAGRRPRFRSPTIPPTTSSIRRAACGSTPPPPAFGTFLGSSLDLAQGKARASAYYSLDRDSRFVLAGPGRGWRDGRPVARRHPGELALLRGRRRLGARLRLQQSRPDRSRSGAVVGGRSLFEASAELRVKVTDTIGIVPFFDAGQRLRHRASRISAQPCTPRWVSACATIRPSVRSALDVAFPFERAPAAGRWRSMSASGRLSDAEGLLRSIRR